MKKFEIETTMNGGAVVIQRHTLGTDGCETSYGDKWSFDSCAKAGEWVDRQLRDNKSIIGPHRKASENFFTPLGSFKAVDVIEQGIENEN